jgi:hypothetical protein
MEPAPLTFGLRVMEQLALLTFIETSVLPLLTSLIPLAFILRPQVFQLFASQVAVRFLLMGRHALTFLMGLSQQAQAQFNLSAMGGTGALFSSLEQARLMTLFILHPAMRMAHSQ